MMHGQKNIRAEYVFYQVRPMSLNIWFFFLCYAFSQVWRTRNILGHIMT